MLLTTKLIMIITIKNILNGKERLEISRVKKNKENRVILNGR